MIVVLGCVIPDAGGLLALGLVARSKFIGSDLSLGRCLGKLVGRLVFRLEIRAGLLAERDLSE